MEITIRPSHQAPIGMRQANCATIRRACMAQTLIQPTSPAHPNPPSPSGRAKRGRLFYLGLAGLILGGICCLLGVAALLVSNNMRLKKVPQPTGLYITTSPLAAIDLPPIIAFAQDAFQANDPSGMVYGTGISSLTSSARLPVQLY